MNFNHDIDQSKETVVTIICIVFKRHTRYKQTAYKDYQCMVIRHSVSTCIEQDSRRLIIFHLVHFICVIHIHPIYYP